MKGKRALVRVDFNVPMKANKILDTRRIEASFETIKTLQKKGMKVILVAHLGDKKASLRTVAIYLSKHFPVKFLTTKILETNTIINLIDELPSETVILLENIRQYPREEKNDPKFSKILATLGDIFVNDAFSVSHREHASVVGVTEYLPSYAGIQLEKEIKTLSKLLDNKKHPFLFILGGAKFSTKIPLINRFIDSADQLIITGAILNSFYKTAGFEVGVSVVEKGYEKEIKSLLSSPKILLPIDVLVLRGPSSKKLLVNEVSRRDKIVDIGPQSSALIAEKIKKSKVVVWNGPTGWYEGGFTLATKILAKAMVDSKAFSVIGGGDTGAVVDKVLKNNKQETKHIFISTGGGATLEYLATGTLPGVKCLK
ncbi:phosphoglycerate kinase [Candidatus Nomurabacteria bacterium]|nr:phosphoglycerate kinase [Candidatus Nomurabacteria bacterium]